MGSHYYHPKTGDLIDGDLRQARKVGGLPSPTTVLGILGSPGLKYYFRRQMFEATATTPRSPDMSDEDYWDACQKHADEHGQAARDKGGDFHELAQKFHGASMEMGAQSEIIQCFGRSMIPDNHELKPHFNAYLDWYFRNVKKSLMVEQAVIGQGYAGRVDHVAEMMDGRIACLDTKTQDITKKKKFTYYSNWGVQLGAYAGAINVFENTKPPVIDVLISVAVSSKEPAVVEAYEWPQKPAYYHGIFLGLLKYWYEDNDYFPVN